MSFQVQSGAEGSLSESVHFPPTSSFLEHHGGYHMDGRMAMAPPLSSASQAAPRPPGLHEDGRGGGGPPHYGSYDRPEYEYALRRHSCGDHLGLHSGNLLEQLLLQENQKALRMASIVQSQASGCLSGCPCGNVSRFRDSEERILEEQRCYSRNVVGEGPSRSVNLDADAVDFPDGWLRQPHSRQSVGERSQSRISFSEDELGRSLCHGRRISYPVCYPTVSHSQASHHVQDHHLHSVGAAESSVPILGFNDADGRVRQRWPAHRPSYSENGTEEDGWQRPSRSRVGPPSAREQERSSLSGMATGSLPRTLVGSPHRPAGDPVRPPQSTRTSSQSLFAMPGTSTEPSYQDNALQQTSIQRLVTQGPISLTNWYLIKVQTAEVGRVTEAKVAVGGWLVQNREHVKTTPIVNRLDIHKVVTEDGVEVLLEGTMDQETSTANGFSPGIVQCLSAGFPYIWKQLLRVRPARESSSLAVSESLGGLHPKASKCLSEDESQGVSDPKVSKTIPEDVPCSLRDCEDTSPPPVVNEDSLAFQTPISIASDVVVTKRAETSAVVEIQEPVTAGAETSLVVEMQEAVTLGAGTSVVVERESLIPASTETLDAIDDDCRPQDVHLQQQCDVVLVSLDCVPAIEAPLEHVTDDSLAIDAETSPITDSTLVTIRKSRKSKKEPSQPVRSSRRLQQHQSRSPEFTSSLVDSPAPTEIEQVTSVASDKLAEEEPAEIYPDVEQAMAGSEDLKMTDSVIEDILMDLHPWDTEAESQDPVENSAEPMEVEAAVQTQDHCEYLSKDSDGVESHESKEKETVEDVAGVDIEATVPVAAASTDLEKSEEFEKTPPVAPPNLEIDQTAPVEREREESAPETPPELLQSKAQSRVDSHLKPSSSQEHLFPEINVRVTRSLKRQLKMSPAATEAGGALPVTRSLKRLRRLSDPEAQPASNLDTECAYVEAVSNPDTPLQEEDHVRVRNPNGSKKCSNCKQPCSPQDLLTKQTCTVVSTEVTLEQVPKEEMVDYAPLSSSQHPADAHQDTPETCSMKRRSDRFLNMKPATRFAKTGTSRRLLVGVSVTGPPTGEGPSKGKKFSRGNRGKGLSQNTGSSIGKESKQGKGFSQDKGSGQDKRSGQGEGSREGEESRKYKASRKTKVSRDVEGSSDVEGCSKEQVLKNRRNSILPPPLPPPRVQDKSRVPEAFGLKTSRSGRLLVPPLAFWRSQSIEYDKDGGIIAIFDGFQAKPADTGCFNFTPPQEKHAKRIQKRLCKAATAITKRK